MIRLKYFLSLLFASSLAWSVSAQPCDIPPSSETCEEAPILCAVDEINGYCTTMSPNGGGQNGPSPLCPQGGAPHNTSWFAFYAGCTNLNMTVSATNCQAGQGAQIAIYGYPGTGECTGSQEQPSEFIFCYTQPCFQGTVNVNANLEVGKIYYFMLDGCSGDVCDISISLNGPCGEPAIAPWVGNITGPSPICTGGTGNYSVAEPEGAQEFFWYLDGNLIEQGPNASVQITWTAAGTYELCVDAANFCVQEGENPPQLCREIIVYDITPTDPQPVTICEDETYSYAGTAYPPGEHDITLKSGPAQCDSVVKLTVIGDPHVSEDLGLVYLCPDDIVVVGGVQWDYTNQGQNEITITKQAPPNCDSTINFEILGLYSEAFVFDPLPIGCDINSVTLDGGNSVYGPPGVPVTFQWSALQGGELGSPSDQPIMTVFKSGKYCLTIEVFSPLGGNSCVDSFCVIVPQIVEPDVNASVTGVITCKNSTATLTGSSQTPNATFQWFNPGGNLISTNGTTTTNVPGEHTFVVTDKDGCTSSLVVIVDSDTISPDASAQNALITCTVPQVNLTGASITPGVNFVWRNAAGDTIGLQAVVPAPGPGTYTLTVTNPVNGCTKTATAVISVDTSIPQVSASTDTLTCFLPKPPLDGGSDVPNATYTWTFGGNTYSTQPDTVATAAGSYTLRVLNPINGCFKDTTIIVLEDTAEPNATASGDVVDCIKTVGTLNGNSNTPGATFLWTFNGNNVGTTPSISVSTPGTYNLLVTGTNGCTKSVSANLTLNAQIPSITVNASDDTINCDVESILLSGSSNETVTYSWTNASGQVLGTNANLSVTGQGVYTLTVTNPSNGCTNQTSVNIGEDKVPPVIDLVQGGTIDCTTDSIQLNGVSSTPGVSYQWFNSGGVPLNPGPTPFIKAPGAYTLVVTGYNGCTASQQATVTSSPDLPQNVLTTVSGPITCTVTSVNIGVTSSTAGVTYFWQGPGGFSGSSQTASVSLNGTYFVTVTNPTNGCKVPTSVQVEIDTLHPKLTASGNLINCYNPAVDISVISNPSSGVTYQWTTPSNTPFPGNQPNVNVSQSGTWKVLVTDNSNGCATTANIVVQENTTKPALPTPTAPTITCANPTATINASPGTTVNYFWSGPGINAANQTVEDPMVTLPGSYNITVTDPVNGCTSTSSLNVLEDKVNPVVQLSGGTLDCNQPTLTLNGNSNPGTGISVQWQLNGANISGTAVNLPVSLPGSYTLTITNNSNGCTGQASATVLLDDAKPDVSATGGEVTCLAPNLTLTGNSTTTGVTYLWTGPSINAANQADKNPVVTLPGTYVLTVEAPNGCTSSATVTVTENKNNPTAVASSSNIIDCTNETTTLSSAGSSSGPGFSYAWSGPGGFTATGSTVPGVAVTGTYSLVVTNANNGCSAITTVVVDDNDNLPTGIDVALQDPRCFGFRDGSIVVSSVTGGTPPFLYSLNNGAFTPNPQFSGLGQGTYTVTIQDAAGCLYTAPSFTLTEPVKLTVDLGPDTIIQWGSDLDIFALINPDNKIQTIAWTPAGVDTTGNSRSLYVKPFNQTLYGIIVTDSSGCRAQDQILVLVEKRRPVYIPNVFAPKGDQNTRFYIQAGEGIESVEIFEVFNRWGERVFIQENFQPNDPSLGWDGNFRNRPANPEVFVYYARIRFNDGITLLYKGDVTLVR